MKLTFTLNVRYYLFILSFILISCKKDILIEPADRYEIPLRIHYDFSNGSQLVLPYVTININGVERDVLFDTGSAGLRIIRGAANIDSTTPIGTPITYYYGIGNRKLIAKGKLGGAYFSLVKSNGTTSIRFMVIDSLGYTTDNLMHLLSDKATKDPNFADYSGVLGVGLGYDNDGPANPIAQLPGDGKYLVRFPEYGDGRN
jgi:hypothetical protein